MQGVSNPQGFLRVTWSDKWALLKEYNVFLNYFIDGRGTATPGNHTNGLNMLWKGQFGLHFPFLRYLHLESCWEARRELRLALRRSDKFSAVEWSLHCTRFGHNSCLLWPGIITTVYWQNVNNPGLAPTPRLSFHICHIFYCVCRRCIDTLSGNQSETKYLQKKNKNVPLLEPSLTFNGAENPKCVLFYGTFTPDCHTKPQKMQSD